MSKVEGLEQHWVSTEFNAGRVKGDKMSEKTRQGAVRRRRSRTMRWSRGRECLKNREVVSSIR